MLEDFLEIKSLINNDTINSIKYDEALSSKDFLEVSNDITINWKEILNPPFKNNDFRTISELRELSYLTTNSLIDEKLILDVDKDPKYFFQEVLDMYGLEFPNRDFNQLYATSKPVLKNLKIMFNRPRPEQLAPLYRIKVNVIKTSTIQTPSYPSGHSMYAQLVYRVITNKYPHLSKKLDKYVNLVCNTRMLQGVHYFSDTVAGVNLANILFEHLQYGR